MLTSILDYVFAMLIIGCATWRLSHMILFEGGPFDFFIEIREEIGIEHDVDGSPLVYPDSLFGSLFSCLSCMSMWVAIGFIIVLLIFPTLTIVLSMPFAVSAIAVMIDTNAQKY